VLVVGLIFAVYFAVALYLQVQTGTFSQGLSSQSDEPAHYVTGLMIRDYVVSGFPGTPLSYAREYYDHYPKVAFGAWPPLFHIVEGGWMLVFGPSRDSVLVLMAALSACLGLLLFVEVRTHFNVWWAAAGGLYLVLLPITQRCTYALMPDTLTAIVVFASAAFFQRYLKSPSMRTGLATGVVVGLAFATKPNALALLLVAPLALLFERRWDLLRARSLWLLVSVALVIGFPAELYPYILARERGDSLNNLPAILDTLTMYGRILYSDFGIGVSVLAVAGFAATVGITIFQGRSKPAWSVYGALLIGYIGFHILMPGPERTRYMLAMVPVIILFAFAGADCLARWFRPGSGRVLAGSLLCLLAIVPTASTFSFREKSSLNVTPTVTEILSASLPRGDAILVVSDAIGEGAVVSEFARLEERLGHRILRGSKVLAESNWNGTVFELIYHRPEALAGYLQSVPVKRLIVDRRPGAVPSKLIEVLDRALILEPAAYVLSSRHNEGAFEVYHLR
jgi:dolichyl-phosphate-mannose-protein mannosyltransferase